MQPPSLSPRPADKLSVSPTNVEIPFNLASSTADDQPRQGRKNLAASAASSSFANLPRQQLLRFLGSSRQLVVVTTEKLARCPPQFGDLQNVFQGYLLKCDESKNITLRLEYLNGTELNLVLSSVIIRSIFPRQTEASRQNNYEACNFFHETGRCAFGPTCRKDHDPLLLTANARAALCDADTAPLCRQQLTLHLATIPTHLSEQDIIDEFSMFGEVSSVNIIKANSLLASGEDWRYAFVTFESEKQALHAKTTLNEDPASCWHNCIQFAKKVTVSPFCSNDQSATAREFKLPRFEVPALKGNSLWLGVATPGGKMLEEKVLAANMQKFGATKSIKVDAKQRFAIVTFLQKSVAESVKANADADPRLDACFAHQKPTAMMYFAKGPGQRVNQDAVTRALTGCDGVLEVQVHKTGEFALVEFDTQDDAVFAFHQLAARKAAKEWLLDFQPIDVRRRLRRQFEQYRQLLDQQAGALKNMEDAWGGCAATERGVRQRREKACALSAVQVELMKTEQALTRMVVQALKQAMCAKQGPDESESSPPSPKIAALSSPSQLSVLAEAIGPEAVQFCTTKHDSLGNFIQAEIVSDCLGGTNSGQVSEAACFAAAGVDKIKLSPSPPGTPMLYRALLSHVADTQSSPVPSPLTAPCQPPPVPPLGAAAFADLPRSYSPVVPFSFDDGAFTSSLPRFARLMHEEAQAELLVRPLAVSAA